MKMTYKKLNRSELEQNLKYLLPGENEFIVELSPIRDVPVELCKEVMSLENILELVEKQGFKVNDISSVYSGGGLRECIGITLNKPFIHNKTKESIEGIFILGNLSEHKEKNYLYSFLIGAVKPYSETIYFSVDIAAKNKEDAKSIFLEKIASFEYPSKEEGIRFIPSTYANGDWVEMEPEEDENEIRFQIEHLTLEIISKLF